MNLPNNVISLDKYRAKACHRTQAQGTMLANQQGSPLTCHDEEEAYQDVLFQLLKEQERRRKKLLAISLVSVAVLVMILAFLTPVAGKP